MKRIICFILSLVSVVSLVACSAEDYLFDYSKHSSEMLKFVSSDKNMDSFLNDYLRRHLRYDDYRIGAEKLGESVVFNKEYEAMSLMWFDTTETALGKGDDRHKLMRDTMMSIPVDDFGYAWSAANHLENSTWSAGSLFAQGWPFPNYDGSYAQSVGYEFNGSNEEAWTSNIGGSGYGGGFYKAMAYKANSIEFISPDIKIGYLEKPLDTLHAPYIHMDIRLKDRQYVGTNTSIEDIYIYYKSRSDTDFSEQKKVSYSQFSTMPKEISSSFSEKFYFPMYLLEDWQNIDKIKIAIKPKEGKLLSINADLNYVRLDYDSRHSNNNAIMLTSLKKYYEYTGDATFLEDNVVRARQMTLFMLEALQGRKGLIDNGYMVGHEGVGNLHGKSIGQGYYDILSTPETSFYANLFYYRAIEAMIYIERAISHEQITIEDVSIRNPRGIGARPVYEETVESLTALLEKIMLNIQADIAEPTLGIDGKYHHAIGSGFWDSSKKRFVEGYDSAGSLIDYGFLAFNLEAVATNIPSAAQSQDILSWADGNRIIEGDTATGKYGKTFGGGESASKYGIYDIEFAPRFSTLKNDKQYIWGWNGAMVPYGAQVQDGGQTMFSSYYDLVARSKSLGEDNAFERLKDIQKWYNKVELVANKAGVGQSVTNKEFYRAYYRELGIQMQGNNTAGGIGLDYEFIESALMYSAVPTAFFGLESEEFDTITVQPKLPSNLSFWTMENLMFHDIKYDLSIGKNFVQIDSVRGRTMGKKVTVKMQKKKYKNVFVNGVRVESSIAGDCLVVTVPLEACKIEFKI